ncbi:sensor histidine kinase [Cohnella silvisoli]|uniref:Sensor histidine kinase n=1 Tax=Cohnella silvisoli TaxID=2873699 RepID=A0ABV1KVJ6_9BACL|nr:sensor histidine kinase [Cohnella silvisoli]MCD9023233.1 sensor histidine kinase [Cohnella silvisoli]
MPLSETNLLQWELDDLEVFCMGVTDVKSLMKRLSLRKMRIRSRLVLVYSTLIFLSILLISVMLTAYSRQLITGKSVDYTVGILEQMGQNIDINLQQIDIASYLIFSDEEVLRILKYGPGDEFVDRTNIEALLVNVMFSRRDIDSIHLFRNSRYWFGTSYPYAYMPYEQLKQAAAKGDGKLVWIKPDKGSGIIQAARIVRTVQMEPVGLLVMNIRESLFTSIISNQLSDINGNVFIVDGEGTAISSLDNTAAESDVDGKMLERTESEIESSGEVAGHFTERIGGEKYIVTYYQSHIIEGWKYISVIPIRELTKDVTKLLNRSILGCMIITGLFVLLSFFVSSGIVNPIKEIAYRMRRMEIQHEEPSNIQYEGQDEIAYLNRSFGGLIQRINILIEEVYEQKLLRSEQELKTLQAQINPHFLYNTLDTVNWMAITSNMPQIGEIVRSLSGIMRYSISNVDDEVSIEEELEHVRNYCAIQTIRFGERLAVTYDMEEDILDHPIPKLVMQPIVENVILHGFNGKEGRCEISIRGLSGDNAIQLEIADNGIGMDGQQLEAILEGEQERHGRQGGIGIRNVDRRLKLKYGAGYGLTIASFPMRGTTVIIRLPH